ncbi:AAA family ATPase [Epibacterium ulvae]|uniref:AAA family ATPase n=1 Tax=Epibacterium ulvae TaxID=1156985 RepID=UPI00249362A8|nr:AAA family ATPase [Epibacterium ulvae]
MPEQTEVQKKQDDKIKAVAEELVKSNKKVQLIYAFNGTGKTRLSRAVKELVAPKPEEGEEEEPTRRKILYYSAFTEDLFVWDNDRDNDEVRKIDIQPNSFTDWVLRDRGQDQNIIANFQRYTSRSITPSFPLKSRIDFGDGAKKIDTFPEIRFAYTGGDNIENDVKISKGEESNLIWSIFYTLLQEVVEVLAEPDLKKREEDVYNDLKYVFIDDPVSSLDDSHLIELAVDLAELIKTTESGLKFIITTHNPLFYNVLFNEFNNKKYKDVDKVKASLQAAIASGGDVAEALDTLVAPDDKDNVAAALQLSDNDAAIAAVTRPKMIYKRERSAKYRLSKEADGSFALAEQGNDSPFSYHLLLLSELKNAVDSGQVQKFHFNYLRNVLEKTATFLGHHRWGDLLPKIDGNPDPFASRIVNLSSHSAHSGEEVAELEARDQEKLGELVNYLFSHYHFFKPKEQNA